MHSTCALCFLLILCQLTYIKRKDDFAMEIPVIQKENYSYTIYRYSFNDNLRIRITDDKKIKTRDRIEIVLFIASFIASAIGLWTWMKQQTGFEETFFNGDILQICFAYAGFFFMSGIASMMLFLIIYTPISFLFLSKDYKDIILSSKKFTGRERWSLQSMQKLEYVLRDERYENDFLTLVDNAEYSSDAVIQDTFEKMYQLSEKDLDAASIIDNMLEKYDNRLAALKEMKETEIEHYRKGLVI